MPEYFICMCLFLFAFLDSAVNSQVSFRDKTQAFFQHNNNVRYIVDTISVPTHGESASPVRIAMFEEGVKPLQFSPPLLDFKERNFGSAHSEKVIVRNMDRNRSVQLLSISGHTLHVQSSFFEDKVIPPLGNTSFQIVFMVRIIGPFVSHLYIHTSEGIYKFVVRGIGKDSPYRLQPIIITQLPFTGVLKQPIDIHNPHSFPITVVEVLQTNPDFKLELPTGRGEGSQSLWKISPFSTKTIMVAHFKASVLNNHTAYIRVKMDHLEDTLFIPVDVTVTSNPGLYIPQDKINFGFGGSLQDDSTLPLQVLNCARRAIKVHYLETEPCSDAIKFIFEPIKVYPNNTHLFSIATLTIDWGKAAKENLTSGKIYLKSKNDQDLLVIPYSLEPLHGGLSYKKSMTTFWLGNELRTAVPVDFTVRNDFKIPIAISRLELQPASMKQKAKALKFVPIVLPVGDSATLVKLGKPGTNQRGVSFLVIHTNISTINVTLNGYDGKLLPMVLSLRKDNELDLGLVGRGRLKDGYFALINMNPLAIEILKWKVSYPRANVQLLGKEKEKCAVDNLLARTRFSDYDRSNLRSLESGSYAVFRLQVEAPLFDEAVEGVISVQTEYEEIVINFRMTVLFGSLEMVKDSLVLPDCFPGKHCFATVQVQSTFPAPMLVESVAPVPHTNDVRFFFAQLKQGISKSLISPSSTSSIGHVLWGGKDAPADLIYIEGYADPSSTACMQLLGLPPHTKAVDVSILHRNWERFRQLTCNGREQWKNYTFWMDTTAVRHFAFEVKVRLSWPRFTNITDGIVRFPLTQVGNTTKSTVEIINSASTALLLHVVLEDDYPEAADLRTALPPHLLPHCSECNSEGSENFGISSENFASSDESSLLREAGVHPNTRLILLGPLQSTRITVTFSPIDSGSSSSMLIIRNSLTVLEVLMLKGKSTRPQLRFSNRLPGSSMPFNFDVPEKLLKECNRVYQTQSRRLPSKSKAPNEFERTSSQTSVLTIKRFFMLKNTGALPIMISGIFINGSPCEGYGFHIVDCAPFLLLPNEGRKLDIAHTPGFTFSRVRCLLEFHTSMGFPVNFTLESFVPTTYLRPCYSIMPRPRWEGFILTISSSVMTFLLFSVLVVAFIESDRIMQATFFPASARRARLDLNLIDNGGVTIDQGMDQEEHSRGNARHHDYNINDSMERERERLQPPPVLVSPTVFTPQATNVDTVERPQWIRSIFGPFKDKSGARSAFLAAAQAAVAQAAAAHSQEEEIADSQSTVGLKTKKKTTKKDQLPEDQSVRRSSRQNNPRKSKNGTNIPNGSSTNQNLLKQSGMLDSQLCSLHSKGNGSRKEKRQRKHAKCTCRTGSFLCDVQSFDENEEKEDLPTLEDIITENDLIHEVDHDPDSQISADLDLDRDTHTDELDSELETSLDRVHATSSISKRFRDHEFELEPLESEWNGAQGSVPSSSMQNAKGVKSTGKKSKDPETQLPRHEPKTQKSVQQEPEPSTPKQTLHPPRQQQQTQSTKRSQGQGNRHSSSDQSQHLRIDSMTVRNRSSWKQSRHTAAQPSSADSKRGSALETPKSPGLELPYSAKSPVGTEAVPAVAVPTPPTSVPSGKASSESSDNSLTETSSASQPIPIRTWEKSFSEMVARTEPQQMYSTVARLGNKTAAQTTPSTCNEGGGVCETQNNEKTDIVPDSSECRKHSSSPVIIKESLPVTTDPPLETKRPTSRGEIPSSTTSEQNDTTKSGKELGPIGPRKKTTVSNTAVIIPWTDAQRREQKETVSVSSSLYVGDKFESFKSARTEQFNEEFYEPFKQDNHVSLRGTAEPSVDLQPSYEHCYQYHDGEGQYRSSRTPQSPVQYDQGTAHYLGSSHNVGHNYEQAFDHSPDLSIDSSSDHSREPSTEPSVDASFDHAYDHSFEQSKLKAQSQHMLGSHHQLDLLIQQLQQQSLHSHPIQQYTQVHSVQMQQPSVQSGAPPSQPVQQQQSHLQPQIPVHLFPQPKLANQNMVLIGGQRNLVNDTLVPYMWLEQQASQPQPISLQLPHSLPQQQQAPQQPPPTPPPPPPPQLQEQIQNVSQISQSLSHAPPPQYQQHGFSRQPSLSPQTSFAQQMQQFQTHQQMFLLKDEQINRLDEDIRSAHFRENWPPTWESNAQLAVGGPVGGSTSSRGASACGPLGSAIVESCLPGRDSADQLQSPEMKGSLWGAVGEARASSDRASSPCPISSFIGTNWTGSFNSQHIRERSSSGSYNSQEEATFDPFRSRTISNIWKTPGDGL